MMSCWREEPSERPDFEAVVTTLENVLLDLTHAGSAQISTDQNTALPGNSGDSQGQVFV